jgi:hypothetical protein
MKKTSLIIINLIQYLIGFINFCYFAIKGFGLGFTNCEGIPYPQIDKPIGWTINIGFLALVFIICSKLYAEFKGNLKLSLILGLFLFILPFVVEYLINYFHSLMPC